MILWVMRFAAEWRMSVGVVSVVTGRVTEESKQRTTTRWVC